MKRNKNLRVFLTLALAVVMCLGTMTAAFAAGDPITADESDTPLTAAITKMLKMPEGTTTPTATFTFTITKKSIDKSTDSADLATMPDLGTAGSASVTFGAANEGTSTSGIKSVYLETGNILPAVTAWPHAGVYVYTITENVGTYTTIPTKETMTYSEASYEITVYVANGTSGLYVAGIGTTIEENDDGTTGSGDKVDATLNGNGSTYTYSQMIFTNTYTKTMGTTADPSDPAALGGTVLAIDKQVAGAYGDRTKYFAFELTLTKAATFTDEQTYKAYVVDASGNVVTSVDNYSGFKTDNNGKNYIEITTGTTNAITINLKHGEKLVFSNAVVGTKYSVTESAYANYRATASVIVNGKSPVAYGDVADLNEELSIADLLIGEGANSAAYTNTYDEDISPMGISLNNLPFVMILVLAAGAFVAFVVVKSRKRARSSEN